MSHRERMLLIGACLLAGFVGGQASRLVPEAQAQQESKVIRAQRFEIMDPKGTTVGALGDISDQPLTGDTPLIGLDLSAKDEPSVRIWTSHDGANVELAGRKGGNFKAVGLSLDSTGANGQLYFMETMTATPLRLGVQGPSGFLVFTDLKGQVVWKAP